MKKLLAVWGVLVVLAISGEAPAVVPVFPPSKLSFDRAEFSEGYPPNILFLIDTGGQMLWSMNAKADKATRIGCTYGDGSLPSTRVNATGRMCTSVPVHPTNLRAGIDIDDTNNYHTPGASRGEIVAKSPDFYHPNLTHQRSGDVTSGLMPNDSRMYKLKLALYRIFTDKSLISGINLGLATFWQKNYYSSSSGGAWADWYKIFQSPDVAARCISWNNAYFLPKPKHANQMYAYDYSQLVTWGVDVSQQYSNATKKARIRRWFAPSSNAAHMQKLVEWFDGVETSTNEEIFADGAQPLAFSIYGVRSQDAVISPTDINCVGSAYHFFRNNTRSPVVSSCQDNWLIVCCDGNDDTKSQGSGEAPDIAVKQLYEGTAQLYVGSSLVTMNRPVRTMVIGFVDPAREPTLAARLNRMADYGDDGLLNDSTGAYFARDTAELIKAFRDVILLVRQVSGSPAAAVVSPPGADPNAKDDGAIYVPSFKTQESDQWQGKFFKYETDALGNLTGKTLWEAGEQLDALPWDLRRIYTANWTTPLPRDPAASNLVRFSAANAPSLASELWWKFPNAPDQAKILSLVRWTLGKNEGAAAGDPAERWKLADINRSGVFVVGKPWGTYPDSAYATFVHSLRSRDFRVYVQSNGGMLHAFEARSRDVDGKALKQGEERWAFIPPQVLLGRRLAGPKLQLGSNPSDPLGGLLVTEIADKTSVPRHLLDGPLAVKDARCTLDGTTTYRTVLVGCLGLAGKGLYALDITSPDTPRFLWAVENANYEHSGPVSPTPAPLHQILWWKSRLADGQNDGGGSGTSAALHAFTHRTYTRAVGGVAVSTDVSASLAAASPDFASMDAYRRLGMTTSVPFIGRVQWGTEKPYVVLFGGGLTGEKKGVATTEGRGFFVAELQSGKILKLISEDRNGAPLGMMAAPVYPYAPASDGLWKGIFAPDAEGNIFKIWGNGLISVDRIFRVDSAQSVAISLGLAAGVMAREVWLYGGTGDPEGKWNKGYNAANYLFGVNAGGFEAPSATAKTLASLQKLVSQDTGSSSDPDGWYFALNPGEYLSAAPTFVRRTTGSFVVLATFTPIQDKCGTGGIARLFLLGAKSGRGAWNASGKKVVEVAGIKISSVGIMGNKLYLTGVSASGGDFSDSAIKGFAKNEGIVVMDLPSELGEVENPNRLQEILYWRD